MTSVVTIVVIYHRMQTKLVTSTSRVAALETAAAAENQVGEG